MVESRGVHSAKARSDPGPLPQFRRIAFIIHHPPLSDYSIDARISLITGKMAQPVVQTIHRDPALLYVVSMKGYMHH